MRYWYVFNIFDGRKPHWHARDSLELASLCRPKRRLRTFRRGPGARRYTCCAVKTLEQFRMVVLDHLAHEDSKLRRPHVGVHLLDTCKPIVVLLLLYI